MSYYYDTTSRAAGRLLSEPPAPETPIITHQGPNWENLGVISEPLFLLVVVTASGVLGVVALVASTRIDAPENPKARATRLSAAAVLLVITGLAFMFLAGEAL